MLNLLEYASVGDLDGAGTLPAFKGGLTLGSLVNLVPLGQNLPQGHVLQGRDLLTGSYRPAFPAGVSDHMLLSQPAIADVDGTGGKEVVQGTGLYLVHAFDSLGREAEGFPRFTGGWNYATPGDDWLVGTPGGPSCSSTVCGAIYPGTRRRSGTSRRRLPSKCGSSTRPPAAGGRHRRSADRMCAGRGRRDGLRGCAGRDHGAAVPRGSR